VEAGTQDKPGQVQEKAQQVAERAQEGAGQARDKVREQVDQRSSQAGQQVQSAAGDARSFAEHLRSQGKDAPARYTEQAADRAERLGGYLEHADGDEILRDVEDFARRNPWAVVAGGVAIGFTLSRMLKASSSERYRQSGQTARLSAPRTGIGNGSGTPGPEMSEGLAGARYDR
jgi:ElaB/YqjD/DUF883 family membrane-anchored ribosome-binding protein